MTFCPSKSIDVDWNPIFTTNIFQKENAASKNNTEVSSVKLEGRKGAGGQSKKPEGGETEKSRNQRALQFFLQIGAQYATTVGTLSTAATAVRKFTT